MVPETHAILMLMATMRNTRTRSDFVGIHFTMYMCIYMAICVIQLVSESVNECCIKPFSIIILSKNKIAIEWSTVVDRRMFFVFVYVCTVCRMFVSVYNISKSVARGHQNYTCFSYHCFDAGTKDAENKEKPRRKMSYAKKRQ